MAVAVRLIEALTLITMLGVLIASTIIVVIADRIFSLLMFVLWVRSMAFIWNLVYMVIIHGVFTFQPTCFIISLCSAFAESLMVTIINCLVNVANNFGTTYLYYA